MKWFLKVYMGLSVLFALWLIGGIVWYLMSMVVIAIFKVVDASLSMKWNPGLIPRIFKDSINYVQTHIITMSLLSLMSVVWISLQLYTYMA